MAGSDGSLICTELYRSCRAVTGAANNIESLLKRPSRQGPQYQEFCPGVSHGTLCYDSCGSQMQLSKLATVLVLAVGLLVSGQIAFSAPILGTISGFGGGSPTLPNSATSLSALIAIGPLSSTCFVINNCPQIALLEGIGPSAIGTIYTLDSAAPNFAAVASQLTNGSLDYISAGVVRGPSYGTTSGGSVSFAETLFGTSPDFAGQTIGSVALRIDGETIVPTNFRLDFTVTVYGASTVPEPSTWLLLTGGLALMFLFGRRVEAGRAGERGFTAARALVRRAASFTRT